MHPVEWARRFLGELSLEEFYRTYWQRKPLLIPGAQDKFASLEFSMATFKEVAVTRSSDDERLQMKAQFHHQGEHRQLAMSGEQVQFLYEAGLTTCIHYPSQVHAGLAQLIAGVKMGFQYPGEVTLNAYLSPAGGGFGWHIDAESVLVLQLEGTKVWKHSARPVIHDIPEGVYDLPFLGSERSLGRNTFRERYPELPLLLPDEVEVVETKLSPGDIFYMPSGTWHRPKASDHSLALSLSFQSSNVVKLFSSALAKLEVRSAPLREFLPPGLERDTDETPPHVREFLRERLDMLKALVNAMTPADLEARWSAQVNDIKLNCAELDLKLDVTPETRLTRVTSFTWRAVEDEGGDSKVVLRWWGRDIDLPTGIERFLDGLLAHRTFIARDACRWDDSPEGLSWDEVKDTLESLASIGIVTLRR